MFGFKKTSELDRLRAVYADQSDSELLRLHEERDGLTDVGRQALDETFQQRGLEIVAQQTASPSIGQQATGLSSEEDEGDLSKDEAALFTLRDVNELRETIRVLEDAGIPLRVRNEAPEQGRERSRGDLVATVIVERSREHEARHLLQQQLKFLAQEDSGEIEFRPPRNLGLLLTCERAEALALVKALSEAGISFYWRDGREDNEVPGEDGIAIEVQAAQQQEAEEVVHAWMAARAGSEEHILDVDV